MSAVRVKDIMSVRVITVTPQTPIKEVATLLVEQRVSGVPVVDGGRVIGIVSESDILPLREEKPARPVRTAADVMTAPVITLTEEATVTEAARVLERHRVKRAPVLREGLLVGIVTRGDLLRPYLRTDTEILVGVEDVIEAQGLSPRHVHAAVRDGVVTLDGTIGTERDRAILLRLVRSLDGVVDVVDGVAIVA
ncbi:MAG TPA: CBS domain-containing protein [Actinomycetota bacterium]|jgi:CBS domain-containing protein|nr:CBS domain-containing protein [Actinomycetota bacterium]